MEQTTAPPPPSAVTTTTVTNPDSVTSSSPRHRNQDSWGGEPTSTYPFNNGSTAAGGGGLTKLRLMCSYGGHIVPRPHDKSLCYVGGDTRIVVVDRHTTLSDLTTRLSKTLLRSSTFTLKYQLPSEDLDSLISVTTDEDLENMVDEYERLNVNVNPSSDSNKSNRIRVFLFPVQPESVSSIGSLLDSSTKSEDWFLNALNGTSSGFSDTSSVNCLLGLEDDVGVPEKKDVGKQQGGVVGKHMRVSHSVPDVQSVPDSPMMETTSSFGSASSSPSLANLPPVRVNVDDQQKVAGIEEQFSQMGVQQQVKIQEDVNLVAPPAPAVVAVVPVKAPTTENNSRVLLEDVPHLKQHQIQQQQPPQQYQQKPTMVFDMTSPDSVSSDGSVTNPLSRRKPPVIYQDPVAQAQISTNNNSIRTSDQKPRIQIQQPQPQFIHTAVPPPQLFHHHPSGAVPLSSYYQMYPPQSQVRGPHPALDQHNQHNVVYYMPARPPPQGYSLPLQADPAASAPPSNQVPPPSGLFTAPRAAQPAAKTEPPVYRTAASSGALPPQLVQPQFVGYSHVHQPSQPVVSGGNTNYVYEFADPSQQGQHIYYPAQHLPPQSTAQYQTITSTSLPVEAQTQVDASMKQQQVRTSQP